MYSPLQLSVSWWGGQLGTWKSISCTLWQQRPDLLQDPSMLARRGRLFGVGNAQ